MRRVDEVSEQGGLRWFAVTILLAVIFGTSIRLWFSPARLNSLIRAEVEKSPLRDSISFSTVGLSLADEIWPEVAIVLQKVEWRPAPECEGPAPIRAKTVRVPFRAFSFLRGEPGVGHVKIDEVAIDLDSLKNGCKGVAMNHALERAKPAAILSPTAVANGGKKNGAAQAALSEITWVASELLSSEEQKRIASTIRGISVGRAEIFFEERMKSVVLEDFSAKWRGEELDVATLLHIPPATVFGETLPVFSLMGTAKRSELYAEVRADLNEGSLEAVAVMKPVVPMVSGKTGAQELQTEIKVSVSDLPLSMMTPLLLKAKVVDGAFQPKFAWLDCGASISGIFSRLFVDHPVTLSQCGISGQVGHLKLQEATRLPDGTWKPFEVAAEKLVILKFLEMFEARGLAGVFTDLGLLNGKLKVEHADKAHFEGAIQHAVVRIVAGDMTALQAMNVEKVTADLNRGQWEFGLTNVVLDGGKADVEAKAKLDRKATSGQAELTMKALKLSPRVEKILFAGAVEEMKGAAQAKFECGRMTKLQATLDLAGMQGAEVAASKVTVEGAKNMRDGIIEIAIRAPTVEIAKQGRIFQILRPTLLGWNGVESADGARLVLSRLNLNGRFLDEGFAWSKSSASIGTTLNYNSEGRLGRDHTVQASIEANFPGAAAKRLRWHLSGSWLKPKHEIGSNELTALLARAGVPINATSGDVPPRLLGISAQSVAPAE